MRRRCLIAGVLSIFLALAVRSADFYVATDGDDSNHDGRSIQAPWRTVSKALTNADYGDTIYLRGGTFREHIPCNVFYGKGQGSASNMLHLLAYSNEVPVISGAVVVTQTWKSVPAPLIATCKYSAISGTPQISDDWIVGTTNFNVWSAPCTGRVQQVFCVAHTGQTNETRAALQQLGWSNTSVDWLYTPNAGGWNYWDIRPTIQTNWTNNCFFWSTNQGGTLYVRLAPGVAPTNAGISIEVGRNMPFTVPADYIHAKGIIFRHSNSPASATAVSVAFGRYCLVENCTIEWMDLDGMVVYEDTVIRNCILRNAGRIALVTPTHFSILDSEISSNNYRLFPTDHSTAGIKCVNFPAISNDYGGLVVAGNRFLGNECFGLWIDTQQHLTTNALIYGNLFAFNGRTGSNAIPRIDGGGLFMENSGAPTGGEYRIYNNIFATNRQGVQLINSSSCKVVNNTIVMGAYAGAFNFTALAHRAVPLNNAIVNNIIWETEPWPCVTVQTGLTKDGIHYDLLHSNRIDNNCYYWPGSAPFLISMCDDDWVEVASTRCQYLHTFTNYTSQVQPAWETTSIVAEPQLGRNFRPGRSSPVLNKSISQAVPPDVFSVLTDFTGNSRVGASSLGAMELIPTDSLLPPNPPRVVIAH